MNYLKPCLWANASDKIICGLDYALELQLILIKKGCHECI